MKSKIVRVFHKELTTVMKAIFGDGVVKNVYVETLSIGRVGKKQLINNLDIELGKDSIGYDAETLIVEMVSGNIVRMGNSEWAHIELIDS